MSFVINGVSVGPGSSVIGKRKSGQHLTVTALGRRAL